MIAPRPEVSQVGHVADPGHPQGRPRTAPRKAKGEALGYSFDPIPRVVEDRIRDGRLKPVDERVLKILLRFRTQFRNSCWATKPVIARKLRCTEKTVQRSFARLGLGDPDEPPLIRQVAVETPDPDEPANKTGWRIYFPFIAPTPERRGDGPDRRRPDERKKWARIGDQAGQLALPFDRGGEDTRVLPPDAPQPVPSSPGGTGMSSVEGTTESSEGRTPVSSNLPAGASKLALDGIEPKTETPPSSSSLRACETAARRARPEGEDDDDSSSHRGGEEETAALVEAARPHFGGDEAKASEYVRANAADVEQALGGRVDCYAAALRKAVTVKTPPDNLHAYALKIAGGYVRNGIPGAAPAPTRKATVVTMRPGVGAIPSHPNDIERYERYVTRPPLTAPPEDQQKYRQSSLDNLIALADDGNELAIAALARLDQVRKGG